MNFTHFPIKYRDEAIYYLHSWAGILLVKDANSKQETCNNIKSKVLSAYQHVNNPYTLSPSKCEVEIPTYRKGIVIYAQILVALSKWSFALGRFFSYFPPRRFSTSLEAILVFRDIFNVKHQKNLCLPRCFFVAATSKSFKRSGVIFIGVFLPSRNMHAWIIEDSTNPDPLDDIWISYQPVAALCK